MSQLSTKYEPLQEDCFKVLAKAKYVCYYCGNEVSENMQSEISKNDLVSIIIKDYSK